MEKHSSTPERYSLNVQLSREEKKQLERVAKHHNMYEKDIIKALLKREAIRISK